MEVRACGNCRKVTHLRVGSRRNMAFVQLGSFSICSSITQSSSVSTSQSQQCCTSCRFPVLYCTVLSWGVLCSAVQCGAHLLDALPGHASDRGQLLVPRGLVPVRVSGHSTHELRPQGAGALLYWAEQQLEKHNALARNWARSEQMRMRLDV